MKSIEGTILLDAVICQQKNAYMDNQVFESYMVCHWIPSLKRDYWQVIICDNFGAHVTTRVLKAMYEANFEVVGIPPHASEILQPLDLIQNAVLKKAIATVLSVQGSVSLLGIQPNKMRATHLIQLLCVRQVLELADGTTLTRPLAPLDAAMTADKNFKSFEHAGIYFDAHHPIQLRTAATQVQ